jgi:hypothetical protein
MPRNSRDDMRRTLAWRAIVRAAILEGDLIEGVNHCPVRSLEGNMSPPGQLAALLSTEEATNSSAQKSRQRPRQQVRRTLRAPLRRSTGLRTDPLRRVGCDRLVGLDAVP